MKLNPYEKPVLIFIVTCHRLKRVLSRHLRQLQRFFYVHVFNGLVSYIEAQISIANLLIRKFNQNITPSLIHLFLITGWTPDYDLDQFESVNGTLQETIYSLTKRSAPPSSEIDLDTREHRKISDILRRIDHFLRQEYFPTRGLLYVSYLN